jgi:hypothetical protein
MGEGWGRGVRNRLYVGLVLAGLVAMALLVVLVLRLGQHDPSPPSLRDHPRTEIPGKIVYVAENGCIMTTAASGSSHEEVLCPADVSWVTWVDTSTIAYLSFYSGVPRWNVVDLATRRETTGATADSSKYPFYPQSDPVSPRGERVSFDNEGSVYVSDGQRAKVFAFDGPSGERPSFVTWSPDGEWILLQYYREEELWIVRRDGSLAGTLAGDARGPASWWIDGVGFLPKVEGSVR